MAWVEAILSFSLSSQRFALSKESGRVRPCSNACAAPLGPHMPFWTKSSLTDSKLTSVSPAQHSPECATWKACTTPLEDLWIYTAFQSNISLKNRILLPKAATYFSNTISLHLLTDLRHYISRKPSLYTSLSGGLFVLCPLICGCPAVTCPSRVILNCY